MTTSKFPAKLTWCSYLLIFRSPAKQVQNVFENKVIVYLQNFDKKNDYNPTVPASSKNHRWIALYCLELPCCTTTANIQNIYNIVRYIRLRIWAACCLMPDAWVNWIPNLLDSASKSPIYQKIKLETKTNPCVQNSGEIKWILPSLLLVEY